VSRKIGIPLTASGRRRKLGASIFNIFGSIVGTLAARAAKQEESNAKTPSEALSEPPSPTGVYFCEVKGVTHGNHAATQKLCSIGDAVKLVPEPNNAHDKNAIRVLLQTGQQIGYISARQAARFVGKVHLLTATVHSRVKDEWGNDTVKLRVMNSSEQQAHKAHPSATKGQSPSLDLLSAVQATQAAASETTKKEGWQSTFIYFENAARELYQVVLASNAEHIRQTIQEGLILVGYIGANDSPKGIQFAFALEDGIPTTGPVAKRFLTNAQDWVVTRSKNLCAQKGMAAPVVHDFELKKS